MNKSIVPNDRERPFLIHELFFSTTDHKGIIESGNDVFVRVSGYSIGDLTGSPHNIVRHPDMPRAVFKLLWDYLKAGKTFAGYVKNMATDGSYYWVMALVAPCKRGFISIRFKPSGQYFAIIKSLYAEMLSIENSGEAGKSADLRERVRLSENRLLAALGEDGFEGYDDFMQAAIASEMTSRRDALAKGGITPGSRAAVAAAVNHKTGDQVRKTLEICTEVDARLEDLFSHVASFLDLIGKLNQRSLSLNSLSKDIKTISLNGVIASNRLGEAGRGLSVVTQALTAVSGESTDSISRISIELSAMRGLMRQMAFAITAAKLQVEMTLFFAREILETAATGGDKATAESEAAITTGTFRDIETLTDTLARSVSNILETLPESARATTQLARLRDQLNDSLRQLSRIRITGKVQSSYIAEAGYFQHLFDNVYGQLETAANELQELSDAIVTFKKQLPNMHTSGTAVQSALGSLA